MGNNNLNLLTKDDAKLFLDNTNFWINNIDSKISFALAFYGVFTLHIFSKCNELVININEIFKFCQNEQIMKIKDFTKPDYDLEKISKEESLRGFFVSDMLEKLKSNEYNKEILEKAIEIGLDAIGR